ncbi:ras family small GTPase [Naegleria gruberi]|uniref:Ras family small GTPase n=1 Tax=Naegleria gruberi TaxID=5762 RepID=D2VVX6_NAEGR|nr:ras family small GTPase [Naegleria gruberi]EFC38919.1 ras family small GTPase [Naegleria gruberi]|eukprot:XP_002671663.1 ras family small GTPase [Naegleria gruberi strain NEG-M]
MATLQSINKDLSRRIENKSNTFWKSLLLDEFGMNNQFIKLLDEQEENDLKRKALVLRKLARRFINYPTLYKEEIVDDCRVCIIGPVGNGKSSLIEQFVYGKFPQVTDPTLEDTYRKQVKVDGFVHSLVVLDTAGLDTYIAMRDGFIRTHDCFVITASLDTTPTKCATYYEELLDQITLIKGLDHDGFYFPIVFVVNKSDLQQEERESTFDEWKNYFNSFIERFKFMNYDIIETSAKSNINVSKNVYSFPFSTCTFISRGNQFRY